MSDFLQKLHDMPDKTFKEELAEASAAYEKAEQAPEPAEKPVDAAPPPPAPVEPVAEEPAVEAPEAPQPPVQQAEKERQVPLKALQEERQKRAELERRLAMLEQQYQQTRQPMAEPEPEEPEELDPETDPIGGLKDLIQWRREVNQQRQQEAHLQHIQRVTTMGEAEFAKSNPDYYDAVSYLQNARMQEIRLLHPGAPDYQIAQAVLNEAQQLADMSLRQRVNPAERFYQLAKARGFGGKAPTPAQEAAPEPEAPAQPTINPDLQNIKKEVAGAVAAGGKSNKRELDASDLLNLKGAAFDKGWQAYFKTQKNDLFRD